MPAGRYEGIIHWGVAEDPSTLPVAGSLTRRRDCPGNPAVIGLRAVRPEVLRPRLSAGLLLVTPGDAAPHCAECMTHARRRKSLRALTSRPGRAASGMGRDRALSEFGDKAFAHGSCKRANTLFLKEERASPIDDKMTKYVNLLSSSSPRARRCSARGEPSPNSTASLAPARVERLVSRQYPGAVGPRGADAPAHLTSTVLRAAH